ncbi:MAG: hypothetical protein NTY74_14025 [Ignavibacteriae bacterium]|nr:hypothetical protein [Ignavibacteriota bacterium]
MKKPLLSKENVLLMFTLGIEVLKSMRNIYETKTEERILLDDNSATRTTGNSKENSNLSDSSINNR